MTNSRDPDRWAIEPLPATHISLSLAYRHLRAQFGEWINDAYRRHSPTPFFGHHDELSLVRPWIFHYLLTGESILKERIDDFFLKWKTWADSGAFVHGYYPKDAEEHHHMENFTRVVARLWMVDRFRRDHVEALIDMAHHIGNWNRDIPEWYDWERHRFVSRWLGTVSHGFKQDKFPEREHANGFAMFRYLIVAEQAYLMTGEQCYLDLVRDYTDQWCETIQKHKNDPAGLPIWFDKDWQPLDCNRDALISVIAGGAVAVMLDLYRMTKNDTYAACARILLDKTRHAFLTGSPRNGDDARTCAITASMLAHYRQVTGDLSMDNDIIEAIGKGASQPLPDSVEYLPVKGFTAELNWRGGSSGSGAEPLMCPAVVLALAWQITGEDHQFHAALELAARRFELIRPLGDEGRFHGCARGNIRTVIDEDIIPVLHAASMGLNGICFDGNAHIQPLISYRGLNGEMGLPETVSALVRKTDRSSTEVKLFNSGERPETVMFLDLADSPSALTTDAIRSASPLAPPWIVKTGVSLTMAPGAGCCAIKGHMSSSNMSGSAGRRNEIG